MITVGTLSGGWRISHTVGYRLIRIDPLRGLVAQVFSAILLFIGAIGLHWPVSTTHTVTASVLGAGENQSFAATNRQAGGPDPVAAGSLRRLSPQPARSSWSWRSRRSLA